MDIQFMLTLAIEVIVISFVALMIFDFIDGLFVMPVFAQPDVISESIASVIALQFEPLPNVEQLEVKTQENIFTPQFQEIPDPWELEAALQNNTVKTQGVTALLFPTLRLLPSAQETQLQPKRRGRPKKSAVPQKPASAPATATKRKPGKPTKVA